MEFCDECGSMMKREDSVWICTQCSNTQTGGQDDEYVTTQKREVSEVIEVDANADAGLPTTKTTCPECSNDQAYWYLQQIRAADESETRFFVCTACEHRWREDDH